MATKAMQPAVPTTGTTLTEPASTAASAPVLPEQAAHEVATTALAGARAVVADLKNKIDAAAHLFKTLEGERYNVRTDAEAFHDLSQRMAFARDEGERLTMLLSDANAAEAEAVKVEQKAYSAYDIATYSAAAESVLPAFTRDLMAAFAMFVGVRARLAQYVAALDQKARGFEPWYASRADRSAEREAQHLLDMTRQVSDAGRLAPKTMLEPIVRALLAAHGHEYSDLPAGARYALASMISKLVEGTYVPPSANTSQPVVPPPDDGRLYLTPLESTGFGGIQPATSHVSLANSSKGN